MVCTGTRLRRAVLQVAIERSSLAMPLAGLLEVAVLPHRDSENYRCMSPRGLAGHPSHNCLILCHCYCPRANRALDALYERRYAFEDGHL